jgi:hypothetical protein
MFKKVKSKSVRSWAVESDSEDKPLADLPLGYENDSDEETYRIKKEKEEL